MQIFAKNTDTGVELTTQHYNNQFTQVSHAQVDEMVKQRLLNNSSSTRFVVQGIQALRTERIKRRKQFAEMKTRWRVEQASLPVSQRSLLFKA